jgi:hypothetical protein
MDVRKAVAPHRRRRERIAEGLQQPARGREVVSRDQEVDVVGEAEPDVTMESPCLRRSLEDEGGDPALLQPAGEPRAQRLERETPGAVGGQVGLDGLNERRWRFGAPGSDGARAQQREQPLIGERAFERDRVAFPQRLPNTPRRRGTRPSEA